MSGTKKEIYTSTPVDCNPFRARRQFTAARPTDFARFPRCDTLAMQFNRE